MRTDCIDRTVAAIIVILASALALTAAADDPLVANVDDFDAARVQLTTTMMGAGRLPPERVAELEETVAENPEDIESRKLLLGAYFVQRTRDAGIRAKGNEQILWLIEHKPASPVLGLPYGRIDHVLSRRDYRNAKDLWEKHIESDPENLAILYNASQFLIIADREKSIEYLERASKIDPKNNAWHERLAQAHKLGVLRRGDPDKGAAQRALAAFERALEGAAEMKRPMLLADAGHVAVFAEEYDKAEKYARELLHGAAEGDPRDWFYGNAIHHGNMTLGHVAFAKGDLDAAERYLIRAGRTPGSPQLNSFGPGMLLAHNLLENGRTEAVIEYLNLCGNFWRGQQTAQWIRTIESGDIPDFGTNLR